MKPLLDNRFGADSIKSRAGLQQEVHILSNLIYKNKVK
jgi:thymidine kinase